MGYAPLIILLTIGLTSGLTVNETQPSTDLQEPQQNGNATARRGRQITEIIEIPPPSKKTKRQIIKIPPNISKVKLVQPPLNLRHNRAPQQFGRYPPNFRSGGPWRPANKKSQGESEHESATPFPFDPIKVKRNLKKQIVKEVSPEEFYADEGYDEDRRHKLENLKKHRQPHKVVKIKRKKPKQNVLGEYLVDYEGASSSNVEEGGFDSSKVRYGDSQSFQGHEQAGSSIHMKQVPPPNLFPQGTQKQPFGHFQEEKFGTGLNVKKLPTKGRQVQSLFSQQYTTHNPHVTTNFGLGEVAQGGVQYGVKGSFVDASPFEYSHQGKYGQMGAASDHVVTTLSAKAPGIQVIQPPQFRDVTVSHPSHPSRLTSPLSQQSEETSSQKATIRDILEQDCPGFDKKGYCDSPPRYPMQQIKNMVKKCASLMEAMNTQPFEEPHEVYSFAKRSDNSDDRTNKTLSTDFEADTSSTWSRSSNDGHTACTSDLELTEPGYAKEVNSGRWFVIVQHPDTTIQRIATDTCRTPGKSCAGLSEMKCTKMTNVLSKSTRCVQRHTYQRLISWDPETPDECPRMRVFRFPSACLCHLGVI